MPIGEELLGFPQIQPAAPATPTPVVGGEEMLRLLSGQRGAFDQLGANPQVLDQTLMKLGLSLMQPYSHKQTPLGHLASSGEGALNYFNARNDSEQAKLFAGLDMGMKQRASNTAAATGAETIATSQQNRGITAAKAPVDLATANQQYQLGRKAMDLIEAEEKSGIRGPDFLKRKADTEILLRDSLAKMYQAHAEAYRAQSAATAGKNTKQTLNVRPVENADGTQSLVSTVVVNGQPYFHTYTPPRFQDLRAATEFAKKEVDKETPSSWNPFAGPAPYQGTREEEIARRAKGYMQPRLQILGPNGEMSTEQWKQMDANPSQPGQQPPATPSPAPAAASPAAPGAGPTPGPAQPAPPQPGAKVIPSPGTADVGPVPMPAASPVRTKDALTNRLGVIRTELRDARQNGAPPADIAALEREEKQAMDQIRGGRGGADSGTPPAAPAPAAPAARPTASSFVRDAQGNIVPATPNPGSAPQAAPQIQPSVAETSGQKFEAARTTYNDAQKTLQSYGVRQQRADPAGYRNALSALARAQAEMVRAKEEYETLVNPHVQPVRGRTLAQ